jgi:hypothetical protein
MAPNMKSMKKKNGNSQILGNKTTPSDTWIKEKIEWGKFKYWILSENENAAYQNLWT